MLPKGWNMPTSNHSQIEKLKREYAQTFQELTFLRQMLKTEVDLEIDEADPGVHEREVATAVMEDLSRKLQEIENALRNLEKGHYGICEACGEPIDPERLEAIPEAAFCISCKMMVEKRQVRPAYGVWRD
jgi:DnaK suppressor protein